MIGADKDGSDVILSAFCQSCITGEKAPNVVEEAYCATLLCLLGNMAMEENKTIRFPEKYKRQRMYIRMTNRTLLATVTALLSLSVSAQVTLDECKTSARDNYPAVKQYRLIELSRDYTMDNASKAWLPKVSVAAGAVAMTDIMENTVAGTAADVSNEIYGAMFQVNQTIYDGGTTAARKRVTRAEADVEKGRLDVTMYDINSRVEELFFGILTIDEKLKQIQLLQNDLELSMRTVNGMINGGLANQSDKDAIKVEQLKASQQESSLTTSRAAYVRYVCRHSV